MSEQEFDLGSEPQGSGVYRVGKPARPEASESARRAQGVFNNAVDMQRALGAQHVSVEAGGDHVHYRIESGTSYEASDNISAAEVTAELVKS